MYLYAFLHTFVQSTHIYTFILSQINTTFLIACSYLIDVVLNQLLMLYLVYEINNIEMCDVREMTTCEHVTCVQCQQRSSVDSY